MSLYVMIISYDLFDSSSHPLQCLNAAQVNPKQLTYFVLLILRIS